MAKNIYELDNDAFGRVRFYVFDPKNRRVHKVSMCSNQILYSGADILAELVKGNGYPINAMYIEFSNGGSPVSPPTFDRTGGIAYYNSLSGDPDKDFIRVPLSPNTLLTTTDSNYAGNIVTYNGFTEGSTGFHGKTFSQGAGSIAFGAALVSSPDFGDQSKDRVFSRVYNGGGSGWTTEIDKISGLEIGVTWSVEFK